MFVALAIIINAFLFLLVVFAANACGVMIIAKPISWIGSAGIVGIVLGVLSSMAYAGGLLLKGKYTLRKAIQLVAFLPSIVLFVLLFVIMSSAFDAMDDKDIAGEYALNLGVAGRRDIERIILSADNRVMRRGGVDGASRVIGTWRWEGNDIIAIDLVDLQNEGHLNEVLQIRRTLSGGTLLFMSFDTMEYYEKMEALH